MGDSWVIQGKGSEYAYLCSACHRKRVARAWQPPDDLREFTNHVHALAEEEVNLLVAKQRDYGPHNMSSMGEAGLLVRMNDKMERLKNLCMSDAPPTQEAIDDTLMDIANYARIWRMGRRGLWPVPFADVVVRRR